MAQDSNSTQNELLLKKIQQMEGEHNNENEKGLKKQYKKLEKALEQYPDEKESPFLESILNKALAQNLEIEEQI